MKSISDPIKNNPIIKSILKNSLECGVVLMDLNGFIIGVNDGMKSFFGYQKEDLLGKNFDVLFTKEDNQKGLPKTELLNTLNQGSSSDNNYIVHKEGTFIWVNGQSMIIEDKKGNASILKIIFSLHKQKQLEKNLIESNDELNKIKVELENHIDHLNVINKELDTFVYTASHDLKAPIGNIESLFMLIRTELGEETRDAVKKLMNHITLSINRLKTSIADLAASGQNKFKEANPVSVSIHDELDEIKFDLKSVINNSNAVIIEDFKAVDYIQFLKKNLRSILFNLVSNALKYSSPDRVPEIYLKTKIEGNGIILTVTDNGLGIKSENLPSIFSLYTRFHTHVEGTGVGMGIVKRIVDINGGEIKVESEEGKGTTFTVSLKNVL